jgi:hypothetical protein
MQESEDEIKKTRKINHPNKSATQDLYRLKKYNSPIFVHSIGLNISIHRHYTRMDLD